MLYSSVNRQHYTMPYSLHEHTTLHNALHTPVNTQHYTMPYSPVNTQHYTMPYSSVNTQHYTMNTQHYTHMHTPHYTHTNTQHYTMNTQIDKDTEEVGTHTHTHTHTHRTTSHTVQMKRRHSKANPYHVGRVMERHISRVKVKRDPQ